MKKRICFIDDDDKFEIPLFSKTFSDEFDLITAKDYQDCESEIKSRKGWKPDLFVLDLYYPSTLPDEAAIKMLKKHPFTVPDDQASIGQAYLNYGSTQK